MVAAGGRQQCALWARVFVQVALVSLLVEAVARLARSQTERVEARRIVGRMMAVCGVV